MTRKRPSNTALLVTWIPEEGETLDGAAADAKRRVSRIPRLRYTVRAYKASNPAGVGVVIVWIGKAREFSPAEAESFAELFCQAEIPIEWTGTGGKIYENDCHPKQANPSKDWVPVKASVAMRHTKDPL